MHYSNECCTKEINKRNTTTTVMSAVVFQHHDFTTHFTIKRVVKRIE